MSTKAGTCPTWWGVHEEHDCCLEPGHDGYHECACGSETKPT